MTGEREAPHYQATRIQRALAEDPRTNELGIRADVRGDVVYLRGTVAGEERRRLVGEVAREAEPGLVLRNEVVVEDFPEPGREETLG